MKAGLLKTTALGTGPTKPGSAAQMMMNDWTAKTVEKGQAMTKQIKRTHVTWMDKSAIERFLSDDRILVKRDDGTCWYGGDFSDKVVAEVMSGTLQKPVTEHNVAAVRKDRYGPLVCLAAPKPLPVKTQLQILSEMVEKLHGYILDLENRVRELEG
jgi:hypothetical protein